MTDPHLGLRPAVLLDRDGTLNEEVDFLHQPEDLVLIPGAAQAVARLNAAGIPVVVITNQSGIGRGLYGWRDFAAVMSRMGTLLALENAHLDAVYACPEVQDHPDRKPEPGMLRRAAEEHGLDLSRSWMVGDKGVDVAAGHRAGCRSIQVATGYGQGQRDPSAEFQAGDVAEAVGHILSAWPWPPR